MNERALTARQSQHLGAAIQLNDPLRCSAKELTGSTPTRSRFEQQPLGKAVAPISGSDRRRRIEIPRGDVPRLVILVREVVVYGRVTHIGIFTRAPDVSMTPRVGRHGHLVVASSVCH
jgi:hypothetical protein